MDYNIAWEVTENCNHNCFYCFNYWRHTEQTTNKFNYDYDRITNEILKLKPISVALTGGEPLTVFDDIKSSIEKITKNNIFIRLLTNGALITDEIAEFLYQNKVQLMISLPSCNRSTYEKITNRSDFDDVIKALNILKQHNNDVLVNVVVNKINLYEIGEIADFLIEKYDFKTIYFSRATKPQNAKNEIENELLNEIELQYFFDTCVKIMERKNIQIKTCGGCAYCAIQNPKAHSIFAKGCGGGKSSFVLTNSGDVRVCGKDSEIFGNIFETDIDEIMKKASFWTDDTAIPKECKKCKFKEYCRGGCHMSAYYKPKYNSLDVNAVPNKVPQKMYFKRNIKKVNLLKSYKLNVNANYNIIDEKHRFSYMFLHTYVSDDIANLLNSGKNISIIRLVFCNMLLPNKAKNILLDLITKQIIVER